MARFKITAELNVDGENLLVHVPGYGDTQAHTVDQARYKAKVLVAEAEQTHISNVDCIKVGVGHAFT